MRRNFLLVLAASVLVLAAQVLNTSAMAQQVSGAIFTTDMSSTFVNGNVYNAMGDVYLNGGPRPNAPCTAAALPNGDYYFQVTDPSGNVLLHEIGDGVENRRVRVEGGVIEFYYGGPRNTGTGKCAAVGKTNITVQLFPFIQTPNPGGEYKVWMTKVDDYDYTMTKGSFGFIPSKSKTDNFKVVPNVDSDHDGIPDVDDRCPFDPDPTCLEG
jgi:hypothetical protein